METIWDRLGNLKDSFYSNVQQQNETTLSTKTLKIALAMYFAQSVTISLIWAIKDSIFWPILFAFTAFLQVGWFWNNITESWRLQQQIVVETELCGDLSTAGCSAHPQSQQQQPQQPVHGLAETHIL